MISNYSIFKNNRCSVAAYHCLLCMKGTCYCYNALFSWLIFFLSIMRFNARILRYSCTSYGNFSYIEENSSLVELPVASFGSRTSKGCEDECIYHPYCKSISVHSNGTCLLYHKSAADPLDQTAVVSKQGWTYLSTSYTERLIGEYCKMIDPCGKDLLCQDSCFCPGYECISWDSITVTSQLKIFTIRHYSGVCVSYRASNNQLRLDSSCNEKFALTSTKNLMHLQSGKCVVPQGSYNDARIGLSSNCKDLNSRFEQTADFAMKHVSTGKCVHPYKGSISPLPDTDITIHSGCNEHRLQFIFVYD